MCLTAFKVYYSYKAMMKYICLTQRSCDNDKGETVCKQRGGGQVDFIGAFFTRDENYTNRKDELSISFWKGKIVVVVVAVSGDPSCTINYRTRLNENIL